MISTERAATKEKKGKWQDILPGTLMKKWIPGILTGAALAVLSRMLLGGDVWVFWTWWLLALVLGLAGMPLTGVLFKGFDDKGWMFSKVLAVAIAGYAEWYLVSVRALKFSTATCVGVTTALALCSLVVYVCQMKKGIDCMPVGRESLILWEEIIFFAFFLIWTYLAGFNPAAYGTEKFMDYGFMQAMMRSDVLPAKDLWYSDGVINYYYGGQYFAVFLTKLSTSRVDVTYNLMRAFVGGFACALPFSLVYQMLRDGMSKENKKKSSLFPALGGLTAGLAVSVAGNMHYVVYAVVLPWIQKLRGEEVSSYWFPDATRYIGYNPDRPDKTIHEFPCYSFVLGDLHAHVVNIMFVLLMTGVLYAWFSRSRHYREKLTWYSLKKRIISPWLLTAAFLLGLFQLNNYWDFVIYFVVVMGTALFLNIIEYRGRLREILIVTLAQAVCLFALARLVIVPFTVQFSTMVDGVALARNHTLPHQLLILWGLPVILGLIFTLYVLVSNGKVLQKKKLWRLMDRVRAQDLFAILLFCCAFGLVLIPELVYVRDIYEAGNARANTMFKLTYQAYILFGMVMGYVIFRLLMNRRSRLIKVPAVIGFILLCWTFGYFGRCCNSWFGSWTYPSTRKGLDADAYMIVDFPEDVGAVNWLLENVKDTQVVLEANGDSYTGFERVSAMTGQPTILGWYVHEWLWRSDTDDLNKRSQDVETIYTSENQELVRSLLSRYDVSFLVIGSTEREKYGDRINRELLNSMGTLVYRDLNYDTSILKVEV